jgi:hypothetical protein
VDRLFAISMTVEEGRTFMALQRRATDGRQVTADARYFDNVESIRASLEEIAMLAKYVRKWTPWVIAAVGVLYPTVGKLISQLPPLPHG